MRKARTVPTLGKLSPETILAGTLIVSGLPFVAIEMFPELKVATTPSSFLLFHNITEFFSVMVSLSMFGIGWYTYDQSKNRHALFLSAAFLGIGLMDFMHTLANAAMPPFITPNSSNKSTQFWIAVRLFQAVAFLGSAYVYSERPSRWLSKKVLMASALLVSFLVFIGITFFPAFLPTTFVPGAGLTPFKKISEYLIIGMLCAAALAYSRRMTKTGDKRLIYYAAAFVVCIFSELSFVAYTTAFDTYNVLGHIYKVAAFYLIYHGIYRESVRAPYIRLTKAGENLKEEIVERKRTEEALRQAHNNLELRVRERTAELARSNAQLRTEIEDRQKAEEALRESEERLSLAIQGAGMGTWDVDTRTGRAVWSRTHFEILGYPPGENGEATVEMSRSRVHPDDLEDVTRAFERAQSTGSVYAPEHRIIRADNGEVRWLSVFGRFLRDPTGEPVRFIGVFFDNTEQKHADQELRQSRDELELRIHERTAELEQSNLALRDFVSIASHDLQEPLRKVNVFGRMLKQECDGSLGGTGSDYLERMLNAGERMQSLLTALLEYSRLSVKADPFVKIELAKIIREVLFDLEARIKNTNGEVRVGNFPVIQADPTQMRQLFQNLIGNGLKFHKEGERPVVNVSCTETDDRMIRIIIEDNGIGFEEKYIDKIFSPFQRLHGMSSRYRGTGMGLAICRKIVERHRGSITAMSRPGVGSAFTITLPAAPAGGEMKTIDKMS